MKAPLFRGAARGTAAFISPKRFVLSRFDIDLILPAPTPCQGTAGTSSDFLWNMGQNRNIQPKASPQNVVFVPAFRYDLSQDTFFTVNLRHIKNAGMYPSIPSIESEIWPLPRSRAWGYTSRTRKTIRRVFGSCVVLVTVSKHTTNFRLWYTLRDSSRVTSVREFR